MYLLIFSHIVEYMARNCSLRSAWRFCVKLYWELSMSFGKDDMEKMEKVIQNYFICCSNTVKNLALFAGFDKTLHKQNYSEITIF